MLTSAMGHSGISIVAALGLAVLAHGGAATDQAGPPSPAAILAAIEPPVQPLPPEAASAKETRFSFIVYGDTREDVRGQEIQKRHGHVVEAMLAKIRILASSRFPARFVLQTGDAVTRGEDAGRWNAFTPAIDRLTGEGALPYFFAVGNHDVSGRPLGDPMRQEGLRNTLAVLAKVIPPEESPRRLRGYPTFAFGYGNLFIVVLDSNIAEDPTQLAWVTSQLEGLDRARYVHVFAAFHHPPLSSGPHGGDIVEPQTASIRRLYLPLFRRHHVQMTLAGHDHLLDHFVERYDDAGGTRRMDHVVTGGGGAPTYTYKSEPDLNAYIAAAAPQKTRVEHLLRPSGQPDGNPLHFVVIRVDHEDLSLEVVGVDAGPNDYMPYRRPRLELRDNGVS
jgi:hypothetical protein